MKTIEAAYIFPMVLMVMANIILLSFSLHDMILYKSSCYKYQKSNNPNGIGYNGDEADLEVLEKYIMNLSLTNNSVSLEMIDDSINISTTEYSANISTSYYAKCDLLRKSSVAANAIENIKEQGD